jgi:hypothetical protein
VINRHFPTDRRPRYYILKDKKPVIENDLLTWGRWIEDPKNQVVVYTEINNDLCVSTVFLGTDHNFAGQEEPILFETMIFGGDYDNRQWRYYSWEKAEEHHNLIVAALKEGKDLEEV